jgi:hydrogenase nickel incorporation protein HypA/HybF
LAQDVVRIAVAAAEKAGAHKVSLIRLQVGELSSVFDESVQMFFDIISQGTIAEGARLEFLKIPAGLKCLSCGKEFDRKPGSFDCPFCGGAETRLTGKGKEFLVESVECDKE